MPFINPKYRCHTVTGLIVTILNIISLILLVIYKSLGYDLSDFGESILIFNMVTLMGIFYGILNDVIACRDCIEYFTVGHFYDERHLDHRPVNTLDPNINAIIWGIFATWHFSIVAGVIIGFISNIPFFDTKVTITAIQLLPILGGLVILILIISHVGARIAQGKIEKIIAPNKYRGVPMELQSKWEACNVRNSLGYLCFLVGVILVFIGIIVARYMLPQPNLTQILN